MFNKLIKALLIYMLVAMMLLMAACGNNINEPSDTTTLDIPGVTDETSKPKGEVIVSDNIMYSAGIDGKEPTIYDALKDCLADCFRHSEILSASIASVSEFDSNGNYVERDSSFVTYNVLCDGTNTYFYYNVDSGDIYTTYYSEKILAGMANKVAAILNIESASYYAVYFANLQNDARTGLPVDVKNEEDFMKYYEPEKHDLSFYAVGRISDIDVGKILTSNIEKIMHDYKFTQFDLSSLNDAVLDEYDFDEIDVLGNIHAMRYGDTNEDTLNIRVDRTNYGFVTDEDKTLVVRYNRDYLDVSNVKLEDFAAPNNLDIDYEPYKAAAVQAKMVRSISGDDWDIRSQDNDFGGTTQFACFAPYNITFYCSSAFDGYYTNQYDVWTKYSNPDNAYNGETAFSLFISKEELINNAEVTNRELMFYKRK